MIKIAANKVGKSLPLAGRRFPIDSSNNFNSLSNPLLKKSDSLKKIKNRNIFYVEGYEEKCEKKFKIDSIECLTRDDRKYLLYILLNIFTLGILSLILNWFPRFNRCLLYQKSNLKNASHMGLYCLDKKFYIVNAYEVNLPNITVSNLLNFCVSNVHSLNTKYFEFKLIKYIYSPTKRCFLPIKFSFNCSLDLLKRKFLTGLNEQEVEYQRKIYGDNKMEVQVKSYFYLFYKEIKDPFYIFQFFSVIMWMFSNYIKYGIVIIITTFIFLSIAIYEIRSNLLDMQKLALYNCEVLIHRSINATKQVVKCLSEDLIPGDLFELPADGEMMPCDAILLSGSVIMNESVLTGESTPIFKTHIPSSNSAFEKERDGKYILFSGTKIIQKRNLKDTKVFGLVLNTGFHTEKGNLIRSILYPKDSKFKFQSDSWKYIIFMAFIAVIGFFITLKYMISYGMSASQIVLKSLDLLTTAVPPALPACIGIGISIALSRLKKSGIKCINRKRVNVAGGVNLICFDKTGTLTEDHLQILGYRPIHFNRGDFIFDSFYKDCKNMIDDCYQFKKNSSNQHTSFSNNILNNNLKICSNNKEDKIKSLRLLFVECLTTCHAITRVNEKLMGDPIDVEMFTATGWILKENSENSENYDPLIKNFVRHPLERDTKDLLEEMSSKIEQNGGDMYDLEEEFLRSQYELGIIRRFDFSSKLQRMSVIVKNVNEDFFKIYCKGSPEKIRELCREETIPDNFHSILSDYTNKGLRVLGLSCKLIKMDFITSQKMSRESAENNMIFLGFIIVQNKLKKNTTTSIEILHNAGVKLIMATGDNLLTAVSVAQDCKLVNREIPVYECEANATNGTEYNLEFKLINGKPISEENDNISEKIIAEDFREDYQSLNDASLEVFQPKRNFEILSRHRSYSKLSHNLNIEVLEVTDESEDEYDIENYDEELKSKFKKMKKIKENLEIDSNRLDVGNLDYTIEIDNYKEEKDYLLAISGKTFELIYKLKNKFFITRDSQYKNYYDIFRYILRKTLIYARMSPEHKAILIDALKAEKYTVCMCGDGANDISALRAADVGVSLSKSEASIAAHFTSNTPEITCLIKLLREGKASLVTSIQFFKYIMLYSFIQFFSTIILLILGTYLSEYEFLIVDLFLIFPLAILIARTAAYKELTPHQPTGALISFPIILSVSFQSFIKLFFLLLTVILLSIQPWYTSYSSNSKLSQDFVEANLENTTIFLVSFIQYLITAISFSISAPFKKDINSNYILTAFLSTNFVFAYYLILADDPFLDNLLNLTEIKYLYFRIVIVMITIIDFFCSYYTEMKLVPYITMKYKDYKREQNIHEMHERRRSFCLEELDGFKLKA